MITWVLEIREPRGIPKGNHKYHGAENLRKEEASERGTIARLVLD